MTHTTRTRLLDPVNPEALMGALRNILNIPPETAIKGFDRYEPYANARKVFSLSCGADAAIYLTVCPSGVTLCGSEFHETGGHWAEGGEVNIGDDVMGCYETGRVFYAEVSLDTAYGAYDHLGCLQCFHNRILARALERVGYTGNWVNTCESDGSESEPGRTWICFWHPAVSSEVGVAVSDGHRLFLAVDPGAPGLKSYLTNLS